MLEAVGFGMPGSSNTLVGMVAAACREIVTLRQNDMLTVSGGREKAND
jgi:hypothetical protein